MNIFKKLWKKSRPVQSSSPLIIPRPQHTISRQRISENALKVMYRIHNEGYQACLVGGSVRDLLLNHNPKDFDVVTNAPTEIIAKFFRNSRIIGRRFRLVHVFFKDEIIEVSTFRANSDEVPADVDEPVMIRAENTYGTIEEDAWRRDFTINALFYNIADFSLIDYTGGMEDLRQGVIRMIGDPNQRFHEDPVRLLRALRLAAKLKFTIDPDTKKPLLEFSHLLQHVPPARLFDEVVKLFFTGNALASFHALLEYHYFEILFPQTAAVIKEDPEKKQLIELSMQATDQRFAEDQPLNPGFLLAVLLWLPLQAALHRPQDNKLNFFMTLHHIFDQVIKQQKQTIMIPKRFTAVIRSIWLLQFHLIKRRGHRVYRAFHHRYFRAALDFLELRVKTGEPFDGIVNWWRQFQVASPDERNDLIKQLMQRGS